LAVAGQLETITCDSDVQPAVISGDWGSGPYLSSCEEDLLRESHSETEAALGEGPSEPAATAAGLLGVEASGRKRKPEAGPTPTAPGGRKKPKRTAVG